MTHEEIISAVPRIGFYKKIYEELGAPERIEPSVRRMRCFLEVGLLTVEEDKTDSGGG